MWLLWAVVRAARTDKSRRLARHRRARGMGLFLFYSARVSLLGAVAGAALLLLRPLREVPRRAAALVLFVLGAWVAVAPVVPVWLGHPLAFFHRMDTSFSLYDPATGLHPGVLKRAVEGLCARRSPCSGPSSRTREAADLSGQGSMSPAAGPLEGVLLAAGLALTLADGWGAGALVVAWSAVMVLGCGVFAQATPWYTRLVPVMAATAVLMARAVDGLVGLVPARGRWRAIATAAPPGALLLLVAVPNLRHYLRFELERPPTVFTAFRDATARLPAGTRYVCVVYQRDDFSLPPPLVRAVRRHAVGGRRARPRLPCCPVPAGRRTAFLVPYERFVPGALDPDRLVEKIRRVHPDARVLLRGSFPTDPRRPLGAVVVVGHPDGPLEAARPTSSGASRRPSRRCERRRDQHAGPWPGR